MLRRPTPTLRLRLTMLYGVVFLCTGAVLLTIGYLLARHNLYPARDVRSEIAPLGSGPDVAVAVRAQLRNHAFQSLVVDYLLALGVMTVLSGFVGWLVAGRVLRPLREITATARRVSSENLGERIALAGPADDLKQLADTFDGMLERLDGAFASQRHFVANASHELRTPLAIMRTEVDVALADPYASIEELRAMGESVRTAVDDCERLIGSLLMLASTEAGARGHQPVDLSALAATCIAEARAGVGETRVELAEELEPAFTRGDPELLARMIANLLDNGIRHNAPDAHLSVWTVVSDDHVRLVVSNDGRVIDPALAASLTEPFRQLECGSRGGCGLGLSIVRAIAEAHSGGVQVIAPTRGGLQVVVRLPRLEEAEEQVLGRHPGPVMQRQPQAAFTEI